MPAFIQRANVLFEVLRCGEHMPFLGFDRFGDDFDAVVRVVGGACKYDVA